MNALLEEIQKLSVAEKLEMLESIWNDLASVPDQVSSPSWHEKGLSQREERIASGESFFSDWSETRKRIAERIS